MAIERLEDRAVPTAAISLSSWLNYYFTSTSTTSGADVTLSQATTIQKLGAYDSGADGFTGGSTAAVGIWSTTGNLIASTSVTSSDPYSVNYRYHSLGSPVPLAAGTYRIGVYYPQNDYFPGNVTSYTTAPGVSFGSTPYTASSGFSFPSIAASNGSPGFFGGNFLTLVPPSLTSNGSVSVSEGNTAFASGFLSGAGESFTLSASVGSVGYTSSNGIDGTWNWSYLPTDGPAQSQAVTITARGLQSGTTTTTTFGLTAFNVAPTATGVGGPTSLSEGQTGNYSLAGVFDPSSVDTTSLRYSFALSTAGLVTTYAAATTGNSFSNPFTDNGSYTVYARVFDKDGGSNTYSTNVTVNNVAPSATGVSGFTTVLEGQTATYSLAGVFDPSSVDATSLRYSFALSTAGLATTYATASTSSSLAIPFTDSGTATVYGRVFDKDGGSNTYSTGVNVLNVAPTATGVGGPTSLSEGQTGGYSLTGVFDPSSVDATSLRYSFALSTAGLAASYAAAGTGNSFSNPFTDNGSYTVYARVFDKDGGSSTYSTNVITVANVAPTATLSANSGITYGAAATASLSTTASSDPSSVDTAAGFHYAFSIDADTTGSATYASSGASSSANFGVVNAGPHTVYARIIDKDNGSTGYTTSYTVNVKALAASIVGTPTKTYDGNGNATLTPANFAISGLVGTDSFAITKTSGSYSIANAGTGTVATSLSTSDFTAGGGTLASNYSLPASASIGAGVITKAHLTVKADDKVRTYNTAAGRRSPRL